MAFDSARSMKKILRFLCGLLINVFILFILVRAFSYSYDFAYQVFATKAADATDTGKVTVQIVQDESLLSVATDLEESGVIENKYAFILKLRISSSANKIKQGTYELSASDTNVEIIDMITGVTDTGTDTETEDDN